VIVFMAIYPQLALQRSEASTKAAVASVQAAQSGRSNLAELAAQAEAQGATLTTVRYPRTGAGSHESEERAGAGG
jgi:hypothetical protein